MDTGSLGTMWMKDLEKWGGGLISMVGLFKKRCV